MHDFLQKVWTQSEPTLVTAAVGIIVAMCGAVSFKVVQYFNDIRRASAVTQAVAAVQQTSAPGTPPEDKRAAALAIIADDPRVGGKGGTATPTELEAAVLAVKAQAATIPAPCPPAKAGG